MLLSLSANLSNRLAKKTSFLAARLVGLSLILVDPKSLQNGPIDTGWSTFHLCEVK